MNASTCAVSRLTSTLDFGKLIDYMTEPTTATVLAEMKPAWREALDGSVSSEYFAGFVRRHRQRLEAALAPVVAAIVAAGARSAVVEDVATTRRPTKSAKAPSFSELKAAALALTERRVKGAADSIAKLRHQDVERILRETPSDERRQVAYVLADQRPDLGSEIDEVMREVLHEPESWGEYGRQEIAKPGTRARREATAAEDATERGRHREAFAEFEFDGTRCVIFLRSPGYRVRVTEGGLELDLDTVDGSDLSRKARESLSSMLGLPSSPGAIREGEALVSASLRDSIRQDNKWKAERVIYVFSLAARRIAAAVAAADVPVAPISTRALTNTPSGRVNLSPAASRMLAKMTDGAWFLTFSRKATSSISAATELRDAGLADLTDHHNGEVRIALPMLTVENHERASTILNATHPEWGIKRFNRDPSDRGHHSYGTGSNSAVLFASDFAGWVVASWLPTAGEVAAEHAARGAYLDENRPGWRERKRAPAQDARSGDGVPEVEWGGGLELAGTADSLTKTLDAMLPIIEEEERRDEGPKPVVMASLEAGGVVMLSPHGYLGTDLFRTYRDATARLQYVSYPKKGQRGTPSSVASAVLALERDGFEVRATTPEVVKSLIVTGGLDHALDVGPPPAVEAGARPSYRTSDPLLIARVKAMAEDPPTSAIKYLVKNLSERGDLPLQVNDWKNGGKRSIDVAIEEGELKVARKLARKPKAERLRADGGERPANGPNEEHAAQALIQLANMDPDKAREINSEGFSKSDVNTGHALARRWEATGELTGDEWEWAVSVANKYRRQVGPLPEPTSKSKRQRSTASDERLFIGVMPTGIAYADRSREVDGDYARCAFLPFSTLELEVAPKCPKELIGLIKADAAAIVARRGEKFQISASNQTVVLGSAIGEMQGEQQTRPGAKAPTKRANRERVPSPTDMSHAGYSLATIGDVVAALRRHLGTLYAGATLKIGQLRSIGDNSVMLTFYSVPHGSSDLDEANAERKVRITIDAHAWPDDATPSELTAYTVWARNTPKLRKRSGPPSVIVATVANWFVLNHVTLIKGAATASIEAQSMGEDAAMGVALRAERDREESEWAAAVERGIAAESIGGVSEEDARRTAIANLATDIKFYAKRDEEKWGYRP